MWPALFQKSALPAVEQTLQFAERRHAILAGNIANADTPGYQTRDLSVSDFQSALKDLMQAKQHREAQALGKTRSPGEGQSTGEDPVRYEGLSESQAMHHVRESMKQILFHDGSDVGLETQVTEIAKNQSMHSTAVAIIRNQYQQLRMAISESVNV
jgi:flagellar basal-body rod protein FlgB